MDGARVLQAKAEKGALRKNCESDFTSAHSIQEKTQGAIDGAPSEQDKVNRCPDINSVSPRRQIDWESGVLDDIPIASWSHLRKRANTGGQGSCRDDGTGVAASGLVSLSHYR